MRVMIYRNLHKDMWSIRDAKTRRVTAHRHEITVTDAVFRVSEAGRQRVIREGQKNVHAMIVGTVSDRGGLPFCGWTKVRYDPRKWTSFVDEQGKPVESAAAVSFHQDGAVYANGIVHMKDLDSHERIG